MVENFYLHKARAILVVVGIVVNILLNICHAIESE